MSIQDTNTPKPFSREYVLRTTAKHMLKSVELSIKKTVDRVAEFEGDAIKSLEILSTLSDLHKLRDSINVNLEVPAVL